MKNNEIKEKIVMLKQKKINADENEWKKIYY